MKKSYFHFHIIYSQGFILFYLFKKCQNLYNGKNTISQDGVILQSLQNNANKILYHLHVYILLYLIFTIY